MYAGMLVLMYIICFYVCMYAYTCIYVCFLGKYLHAICKAFTADNNGKNSIISLLFSGGAAGALAAGAVTPTDVIKTR
jgi:hypothetical protein